MCRTFVPALLILSVPGLLSAATPSHLPGEVENAGVVSLQDSPPQNVATPTEVFTVGRSAAQINPYAKPQFQRDEQPQRDWGIRRASWEQVPGIGGSQGWMPSHPWPGAAAPWSSCCPPWKPYVELQTTFTNQRDLGDFTFFVPVLQDEETMVFVDFRGQWDSDEHYEGNIGGGVRRMIDDRYILGVYGFYDSRWTENNHFSQATMGVEALAVGWEFRANGYIPDTNLRQEITDLPVGGPFGRLVGQQVFVVTPVAGRISDRETALYGFDWEVGKQLGAWGKNQQFDWRAYAGGYFFDSDEMPGDLWGPRLRSELRVWNLPIGPQSRLVVGTGYQWDRLRNDQYSAYLQVRIPLGGAKQAPELNPLSRRMLERVVRDPDVLVVRDLNVVPRTEQIEPATFDNNGRLALFHGVIDANTPNAPGVLTTAGDNTNIFVDGRAGATIQTNNALVTQNGQFIVASEQVLGITGTSTGTKVNFQLPGPRPTVVAQNTAENAVAVTNNVEIRGLDVSGGASGFSSDADGIGSTTLALSNVKVIDSSATNALLDGFWFDDIDANSVFRNNRSENNGTDGFHFGNNAGLVQGNTSTGNTLNGFLFTNNNGTIIDNVTENIVGVGFSLTNNNGTFMGNTARSATGDGFTFTTNNGVMTNNTAEMNGDDGFNFTNNVGTFSNNVSDNNTGGGYDNGAGALPANTGTAVNNTGTGNTGGNNTFP